MNAEKKNWKLYVISFWNYELRTNNKIYNLQCIYVGVECARESFYQRTGIQKKIRLKYENQQLNWIESIFRQHHNLIRIGGWKFFIALWPQRVPSPRAFCSNTGPLQRCENFIMDGFVSGGARMQLKVHYDCSVKILFYENYSMENKKWIEENSLSENILSAFGA